MEERVLIILESDVLKSQRLARTIAVDLGFDEAEAEEAAIIATELASNLIKHRAIKGEIILRCRYEGGREGLEIESRDTGPGIVDIDQALQRSSIGTLGPGLSGVKRLSDHFDLTSTAGSGTIVAAVKWLKHKVSEGMHFSVLTRPYPGEEVNGDSWFIRRLSQGVVFGVIDALGHGREAYLTSLVAMAAIKENFQEPLDVLINRCHHKLKRTRGVAMSVCQVDYARRVMRHVGIGNVETKIFCTSTDIRPFCFNGTVGMRMENFQVVEYPYEERETVVMFSDGVSGQFELVPDKLCLPLQELAEWIFRDFIREHDDATVLVGR